MEHNHSGHPEEFGVNGPGWGSQRGSHSDTVTTS